MARRFVTVSAVIASAAMLLASLFAPVKAPGRGFEEAAPTPVVVSPRIGHYDPSQGQYVWWR